MGRPVLAFLIAPLWVPLIFAPYAALNLFPNSAQSHWVVISTIASALFAYAGTLVFGFPPFLILRVYGLTHLWIAAAVGFLSGAFTSIIFNVCFALSLGYSIKDL